MATQSVKSLPAMWEIQVGSLGQEDPLENEMATHSSTLAWRILWTEETYGLVHGGHKKLPTTVTNTFTFTVHVKNKGLD